MSFPKRPADLSANLIVVIAPKPLTYTLDPKDVASVTDTFIDEYFRDLNYWPKVVVVTGAMEVKALTRSGFRRALDADGIARRRLGLKPLPGHLPETLVPAPTSRPVRPKRRPRPPGPRRPWEGPDPNDF